MTNLTPPRSAALSLAMATLMAGAANAQQLAPDDTTISAGLQLWLRDAAANFDPDTGT